MPRIAEAEIPVVFAKTAQHARAAGLGRPAIAITPDYNVWNDFGYRHYANMHVMLEDREETRRIRLMFEGEDRVAAYLDSLFEEQGPVVPIAQVPTAMVALQRSAETYRSLVNWLGLKRAATALRALGDAVLLTLENDDPPRLALIASEPFHAAEVREPGVYWAFRRGGQHLRATPAHEVDDAATTFTFQPGLPGGPPVDPLLFDFAPDALFDDRVVVLIGRNGAGKTQSLVALIEGLTENGGEVANPFVVPRPDPVPPLRRVLMFSSVPSDPYPKAILPWTGIDYEYHAVAVADAPLGKSFILSLVDCIRDDGTMFGDQLDGQRTRRKLLTDTLGDLGMWDNLYIPLLPPPGEQGQDLYAGAVEVDGGLYFLLDHIDGEQRTVTFYSRIDWSRSAIVTDDFGTRRHLSSGELAMLQFATQAIASIEQGSLLLLDEPETHLHPNYIVELMDLLQELLKRTGSIAIIATHSAYVVREVPRQRVNIFLRQDGDLTIEQPRIQTYGAAIDSLSQYIFGDTLISHRYRRVLRRWAETEGRELGLDGVIDQYGGSLNPETLSFIARVIEAPEAAQ